MTTDRFVSIIANSFRPLAGLGVIQRQHDARPLQVPGSFRPLAGLGVIQRGEDGGHCGMGGLSFRPLAGLGVIQRPSW